MMLRVQYLNFSVIWTNTYSFVKLVWVVSDLCNESVLIETTKLLITDLVLDKLKKNIFKGFKNLTYIDLHNS